MREYFGSYSAEVAVGLALRHDHGSVYLLDQFPDELRLLGIESLAAFVSEPEGNGCVERFLRNLKENLPWMRDPATVEKSRRALLEFRRLYNERWILKRPRHSPRRGLCFSDWRGIVPLPSQSILPASALSLDHHPQGGRAMKKFIAVLCLVGVSVLKELV